MNNVYIICFAVGLLYTLVSAVISGVSGIIDIGGHMAGGHGADPGIDGNSHFHFIGVILNPLVAVSFLTVFGGIGIVGSNLVKFPEPFNGGAALLMAIGISAGLYKFIVVPIYNAENSTDVSRESLVGIRAMVVSPILENGFGEISYTVNSLKYNAPAKHLDNKSVAQGNEVVVYKIENNVFYVSEFKGL